MPRQKITNTEAIKQSIFISLKNFVGSTLFHAHVFSSQELSRPAQESFLGVGSPMQLPVNERETHLPQFFSPPSPLFPGKEFNAPSLSSLLLSSNGERCKEKVFRQRPERLLCTTMSLKRNENVFNNTFLRNIKGSMYEKHIFFPSRPCSRSRTVGISRLFFEVHFCGRRSPGFCAHIVTRARMSPTVLEVSFIFVVLQT